jgi:predicted nucleic acid-binding protein
VLDSGPAGLLSKPRNVPDADGCRNWFRQHVAAGSRFILPEIVDYELRRELLRARKTAGVARLDALAFDLEYLPITTSAMRLAAELWAQPRQQGQPTAGDKNLDADMILVAQTQLLNEPDAVIATTNTRHLIRFVNAELWEKVGI